MKAKYILTAALIAATSYIAPAQQQNIGVEFETNFLIYPTSLIESVRFRTDDDVQVILTPKSNRASDLDRIQRVIPVTTPGGDGSSAHPFTVAEARSNGGLLNYEPWHDYCVKGIISEINDNFSDMFGDITLLLQDETFEKSHFIICRTYGLKGEKFTSLDQLKVGDEVIAVFKYRSDYANESQQHGYILSLNGSEYTKYEFIEPEGDGTEANPFNIAGILQYTYSDDVDSEKELYVKGTVSRVDDSSFNATYGNLNYYISDTGTRFDEYYVWRGYYIDGAKFTSASQIKPGDEVVLKVKTTLYNATIAEALQGSSIVSVNGETTPVTPEEPQTPDAPNAKGSENNPWTVEEVIDGTATGTGWTEGYIVGWVDGMFYDEGVHFNADATLATNIVIASDKNETGIDKCVAVQLPAGDVRIMLNLMDNPGNLGKYVKVKGEFSKYFGRNGVRLTTDCVLSASAN